MHGDCGLSWNASRMKLMNGCGPGGPLIACLKTAGFWECFCSGWQGYHERVIGWGSTALLWRVCFHCKVGANRSRQPYGLSRKGYPVNWEWGAIWLANRDRLGLHALLWWNTRSYSKSRPCEHPEHCWNFTCWKASWEDKRLCTTRWWGNASALAWLGAGSGYSQSERKSWEGQLLEWHTSLDTPCSIICTLTAWCSGIEWSATKGNWIFFLGSWVIPPLFICTDTMLVDNSLHVISTSEHHFLWL